MFPFFRSPGTSSDLHDFPDIMESGLATTSASSLRTLGCIPSGPRDLWMFRFLRWSWTRSSLTLELCSCSSRLAVHPFKSCGNRGCQWRQRQKCCWLTQPPSRPFLPVCQSYSSGGYAFFDLPLLADILVKAILIILPIPCQVQLQLHPGLPDTIPTQPVSVPVLFPGYLPLLPLPVHILLAL